MQNPDLSTPIPRCLHLGHFTAQAIKILLKDPSNPNYQVLSDGAAKMAALTGTLKQKHEAYEASKYVIVEARVGLRVTDYFTDFGIGTLLNKVEELEQQKNGPIFNQLAPDGRAALTRPVGQSQLDVLVDLATKLGEIATTWKPATALATTVGDMRTDYKAALDARTDAWTKARDLRLARDVAKAAFVKGYNEISLALKAAHVGNKRLLELLFDEVAADVEKDLGDPSQGQATATEGHDQTAAPAAPAPGDPKG